MGGTRLLALSKAMTAVCTELRCMVETTTQALCLRSPRAVLSKLFGLLLAALTELIHAPDLLKLLMASCTEQPGEAAEPTSTMATEEALFIASIPSETD